MSDDFQRFLIPKNESDYEIISNYFKNNQTPLRITNGVDFETLKDLKLKVEDVEEKYNASKNKHFSSLKKELEEARERAKRDGIEEDVKEFEYLQENLLKLFREKPHRD